MVCSGVQQQSDDNEGLEKSEVERKANESESERGVVRENVKVRVTVKKEIGMQWEE